MGRLRRREEEGGSVAEDEEEKEREGRCVDRLTGGATPVVEIGVADITIEIEDVVRAEVASVLVEVGAM